MDIQAAKEFLEHRSADDLQNIIVLVQQRIQKKEKFFFPLDKYYKKVVKFAPAACGHYFQYTTGWHFCQ